MAKKQPIRIKRRHLRKLVVPDEFESLENGDSAYGVIARADIPVPYGADSITVSVQTPGVWGVDYDGAHGEYGDELFEEEVGTLEELLSHLNVKVV